MVSRSHALAVTAHRAWLDLFVWLTRFHCNATHSWCCTLQFAYTLNIILVEHMGTNANGTRQLQKQYDGFLRMQNQNLEPLQTHARAIHAQAHMGR